MNATATQRNVVVSGPSLVESIASFVREFRQLKSELQAAARETAALRREVNDWRARHRQLSRVDVAALRRRLAFQYHPDRGGDAELMSTLNSFFDAIEGYRHQPCLDPSHGG
jgi:hypothetical protein